MTNQSRINQLTEAIIKALICNGYADIRDTSYNPDYTINIGLTVEELRLAADLARFQPTKKNLQLSSAARKWRKYLDELDS